jgi:hypothetical protein
MALISAGYAAHDPNFDAVPWYEWLIKCVAVGDIICMLVAGRYGRSAAMIHRVNTGQMYKTFLIRSVLVSGAGLCISLLILPTKAMMPDEWTLIDKTTGALRVAGVVMFFFFIAVKILVQTISLALCVRWISDLNRKTSAVKNSDGGLGVDVRSLSKINASARFL